jgi:hypothetical protein
MTTNQVLYLYAFFMTMFAVVFYSLHLLLLQKQYTVEQHADKVCQALYGPQTGAIWGEAMQCQTVRGEMLPVKKP